MAVSVLHDIALFMTGFYSTQLAPTSINQALGLLDQLWIAMLMIGAILGFIGAVFRKSIVEIPGCVLMASGLMTWSIAYITQNSHDPTSYAAGAAFAAGGFAVIWRTLGVLIGVYIRVRD